MAGEEQSPSGKFDSLREAFEHSGMSLSELWGGYVSLGGLASQLEMEGYVFGAVVPERHEHNILAQALNEKFMELGMNHPAPYLRT